MHKKLPVLLSFSAAILLTLGVGGCKSHAPEPNLQNANGNGSTLGSQSPDAGNNPTSAGPSGQLQGNLQNAQAGQRAAAPSAPKPPQKITLTVDAGREVSVRIHEGFTAKTANVGDAFGGELAAPLTTQSGKIVFAKGTPVEGSVVSAKGQGRFAGAGVLAIELRTVGGVPVQASEYVVSQKGKGKRTAALIGGGAGLGALIGGLTGGGKGAAIGGAIGGGAGTAGAGLTGNKQLVIPAGSDVVFELQQPVSRIVTQ